MKNLKLLCAVLNLFDGATGTGTGEGVNGEGSQVGSQSNPGSDHRDGGNAGDAAASSSKTFSGGSDGANPAAGDSTKKLSETERRAEFRRLVEGEYKDIYEREFQKAFNRKFRNARETEERLSKVNPLLDKLMTRYNIAGNDVEALSRAVDNDRGYWANAAEEAGMSEDQYMEILRLRSDSRRLAEIEHERERQATVQRQLEAWNNAASEVREVYPDFDINALAENSEFMSMISAGVPMKHAYEVLNLDGIKSRAAKDAAEAAEKNVVEGIRARGTRPNENGTSSQNGITTATDISKLSLKEITSIMERARSGEKITFR